MTATVSPVTARDQEQRGFSTSAFATFVGTWQIGLYFWIAVVLISAGLTVVLDTWSELDGSVAEGVLGSAPIFLSVMGIVVPLGMLPLHLAGGATRRSFVRGTVTAAVGLGVTFALAGAVGMLIEYAVFNALDWPTVVDNPGLYDSSGDFFAIWLSWSLSSIAYFLAGTAIGFGYYRWGGILGTVQLVVAVGLVIGGELALGGGLPSGMFGELFDSGPMPLLVGVLGCTAAIAALTYLVHRTLRDIPLKSGSRAAGC
ncbi:hypothetical protein FE697_019080 [Mumia zhuanghuii]|uniref:ABC transporter permease n=2 Tax=Mumia TaxID=1546255 RepID=A0ABW1QQT3_9ACTN|nr:MULTISPECIES: hypothetical protein [Mumia]KAA1419989.1 hypothetical protein FE697_019080 [Mumia zhuanghuii]